MTARDGGSLGRPSNTRTMDADAGANGIVTMTLITDHPDRDGALGGEGATGQTRRDHRAPA